jgi:hypothetical protein
MLGTVMMMMMTTTTTTKQNEKKTARAGLPVVRGVEFRFKTQIGLQYREVTWSEISCVGLLKPAHHLILDLLRPEQPFSLVADTPSVVMK